jgi:hypothetical protein
VSTRSGFAVVVLACVVGSSAAAEEAFLLDLERVLAPRPTPPASEVGHLLPLRLVWTDPAGAGAGLERLAREEADGLLKKMGLSVSWRKGDARETARPGEVRVILLDRPASRESGAPVLGATPQTFAVSPFVWVHVPGVRLSLGLARPAGAGRDLLAMRLLAVAVGRVIAHEVVHALAPAIPHGTGLMSATLTRRQLTARSIPFDPAIGLAVKAALRGGLPVPRPDTGVVVAATAAEEERGR